MWDVGCGGMLHGVLRTCAPAETSGPKLETPVGFPLFECVSGFVELKSTLFLSQFEIKRK